MNLDIQGYDRNKLFEIANKLSYIQGQLNTMSDAYSDDSPEADELGQLGPNLSYVIGKINEIIAPRL